MRKLMRTAVIIALWSAATMAAASVYFYVDENGVYHFTNNPTDKSYDKVMMWEDGGGDPTIIHLDPNYNYIIEEACKHYKVDPRLIKAMIKVESNFNRYAESRAGAQGLMQLMPDTARRFNVKDPFHPVENIYAGVYFVKHLMVKYNNNWDLVLAAYNAGETAVAKYGGIPPYKETRGYVKKVKYYWEIYKKQEPRFKSPDPPPELPRRRTSPGSRR